MTLAKACDKICLLTWKNWKSEKNHVIKLIVEIILPSLLVVLLILARVQFPPKLVNATTYPPFFMDSLIALMIQTSRFDLKLDYKILYTPKNSELKKVVERAARGLGLASEEVEDVSVIEDRFQKDPFLAGIVFDGSLKNIKDIKKVRKFSFTLRFPMFLRNSRPDEPETWMTNRLFPSISPIGPRNPEDTDGGVPPGYLLEGFLVLQNSLTRSFLELADVKTQLPLVMMQRFPYPPYKFDEFIDAVNVLLPLFIMISYMFSAIQVTKKIVREKEKRHKAVLNMMGVHFYIQWIAWFFHFFIILLLATILLTIVLKVPVVNDAAVFTNTSWSVLFVYLLVYVCAMLCFCFLISIFFSHSNTAATLTGLIIFFNYFPYFFISDDCSVHLKRMWCLLPSTALCFGIRVICIYEGSRCGMKWDYVFTPVNLDDKLTVGSVMLMMLISCFLNIFVALYLEQIKPGPGNVPKKWYFPLTKRFWTCSYAFAPAEPDVNFQSFEPEPSYKTAGLQVLNIRKVFPGHTAVKGVSLNLYEDQITVLLGHNGAGKTTLISMLTGSIKPTSGTALINGYDILTQTETARKYVGICPQHNSVFEDLTVMDHLIFYGRLKGLMYKDAKKDAKMYLRFVNLQHKAKNRSATLSGGMQRRLCLCCAFCGGAKVVFCDEPSSGLDPYARRQLWRFLQSQKSGRTILLTTHYMDEADALGDRIAIMCKGQIKCCGSSFFLKKKYGSGYRLVFVKEPGCEPVQVTNLVRKHIPYVSPESNIGNELTYTIADQHSGKFQKLFTDLDTNLPNLKVSGYGVGISSMEEVFMQVGSERSSQISRQSYKGFLTSSLDRLNSQVMFMNEEHMLGGWRLSCNQWRAMIWKKFLYYKRSYLMLSFLLLIPIFFAVVIFSDVKNISSRLPKMSISLQQYPKAVIIVEDSDSPVIAKYKELVKSFGSSYKTLTLKSKNMNNYLLGIESENQMEIDTNYITAIKISKGSVIAGFNNQFLHTAPLALNLAYNAIARAEENGADTEILVNNWPLVTSVPSSPPGGRIAGEMALSFTFCIGIVTSFFVLYLVKERQSRFKLLQFISGARVLTFWIVQLLFDYLIFAVIILIIVAVIACFRQKGFDTVESLGCLTLIFAAFGFTILPFICLMSFLFKTSSAAYGMMCFLTFFGMSIFVMFFVLSIPGVLKQDTVNTLHWGLMVLPHFTLAWALFNFSLNTQIHETCSLGDLCDIVDECCSIKEILDWENPGILKEIIFLVVSGFFWFILLLFLELDFYNRSFYCCCQKGRKRKESIVEYKEEDVQQEINQIKNMTKSQIADQNLVLDQVSKNFCRFKAVKNISVNECVGLLGANGAGKTTTFKMMTGEERISSGEVYVCGLKMKTQLGKIYRKIGYCPQFDAVMGYMTGRNTLDFFGLLRGVPKPYISNLTEYLADCFGFKIHLDKKTKNLSGGNRRKLSAAITCIGNPSVIFLDEPTCGIDPDARRHLWNMVCGIREAGKSVVLTSHSMEECEALCTRMAIMVNGEFKCLGSAQQLKNRFSKGMVLKIKLQKQDSQTGSDADKVKRFVTSEFPNAHLKEEYDGLLTFYIPLQNIQWSSIFGTMQANRKRLNIEDYSISQTSLEEIFLDIAMDQLAERRPSSVGYK